MNRPDPLDRLLDEVQPPPPPADFAARIAANATAQPQTPAAREPRDRRGAWARRHRTLATFIAANLLVASAVAAAIVSGQGLEPLRRVPLIAPVIERIAPRHHHMVKMTELRPHVAVHPAAALPAPQPAAAATPLPVLDQQLRARQAALAGIVQRREAAGLPVPPRLRARAELQDLRRQAVEHRIAGEPVPPALRKQIVRHRLAVAPPAVRRQVREAIRERRATGQPVPPMPQLLRDARGAGMSGPERAEALPPAPDWRDAPSFPSFEEWRAARRERMRRYVQSLSPEERRQFWQQRPEERERALDNAEPRGESDASFTPDPASGNRPQHDRFRPHPRRFPHAGGRLPPHGLAAHRRGD